MLNSASRGRRFGAVLLAAVLGLIAVAVPATPAWAAPSVTVHVETRPDLANVADPSYVTELRLTGTGFQSIVNGHGGIYVAFGWVDGAESWRPSNGGVTGSNYRYVPDDETNPTGYIVFVSFPGGDTAYAANGGEMSASGDWSAVITIPGAQFESYDRDGNVAPVDCLQVTCGVMTFGAHGVKNANNETFSPVAFSSLYEDGADAPAVAAPTAPTPAPTQTVTATEVVEETVASSDDGLLTTMVWIVGGIGALALVAVVFLIIAVLGSRRRRTEPAEPAAVDTGREA